MKTKLLLTAFLAFFAISAFSQSYEPFINFDKYWKIQFIDYQNPQNSSIEVYRIEDSLLFIDGRECYRFAGEGPRGWQFAGYISEDTATKQVFLAPMHQPTFSLYYDYSLDIGDTLKRFGIGNMVVTGIDSIMFLDSTYHKTYLFDSATTSTEVIGFGEIETTFFFPSHIFNTWDFKTLCIGVGSDTLYVNCASTIFNVPEEANLAIEIYPNPASHTFTLNLENANTLAAQALQVEIYNMQGQRCLCQILAGGPMHHPINVEALSSGLYFVEIKNQNGKALWREKLMIE